jgi:TolA-binding protein
MTWIPRTLLLGVIITGFAVPAAAQQGSTVTQTDIQRLQDSVYLADRDVSQARSRDAARATQLQTELDDLRDEVVYLKVKLRKERTLARSEYADVRDRIQNLRSRARGETTRPWTGGTSTGGTVYEPPRQPDPTRPSTPSRETTTGSRESSSSDIPVGSEIDVRLQTRLSSDDAQVEQRFEATTMVDLYRGNDVLIPAGSVVRGVVSSVNRASRTDRKGSLTLSFDQITVRGRAYPMRGTVTEALESEGIRGEAARIGAGSAVGAIIGGIVGGVKGALIGVLIGGGGTIAATEGKDVTLPAGTVLRVRMDTPPAIR